MSSSKPKRSKTSGDSLTGIIDAQGVPQRPGYARYQDFYESPGRSKREDMMIPDKGLRNYIRHESGPDVENDGVYLTYEMQQTAR